MQILQSELIWYGTVPSILDTCCTIRMIQIITQYNTTVRVLTFYWLPVPVALRSEYDSWLVSVVRVGSKFVEERKKPCMLPSMCYQANELKRQKGVPSA